MRDEYLSLLNMISDIQSLVIYMKEYLLREVNLLSKGLFELTYAQFMNIAYD